MLATVKLNDSSATFMTDMVFCITQDYVMAPAHLSDLRNLESQVTQTVGLLDSNVDPNGMQAIIRSHRLSGKILGAVSS